MRQTGILMPVSSLPSRTGVGEMGNEGFQFLELLRENGVKIWQTLPMNPVGYGNSPYQPYSSYAGDELYISLDLLYAGGLLKNKVPSFREDQVRVDYDAVRNFKDPYLRESYEIFCEKEGDKSIEYQDFVEQKWVFEYGVFRALKKANKGSCWVDWKDEHKNWPEVRQELEPEIEKEIQYHVFLQYIFYTQWKRLKEKANEYGIRIMGDVPFYVGLDSVDVWVEKNNFMLDTDGRPIYIAGVPPDYFSVTGQRWGNPIYDWEYLKKNKYKFWVDRIRNCSLLFDIVRIDHFRAFDTFWQIPASCPTAMEGEWIEAPGYEVLDILKEKIPEVELVAEDLGDLRTEVLELKEHYYLKGMKIFVFAMDTNAKYVKDTFHDVENMIIYTGTHDNDTIMEWYYNLNCAKRRKVRRYLARKGIRQGNVKDRILTYILESKAQYAIIPMADILGQGKEGHINTPGTVGSPNWEWKIKDFELSIKEFKKYRKIIKREEEI